MTMDNNNLNLFSLNVEEKLFLYFPIWISLLSISYVVLRPIRGVTPDRDIDICKYNIY